MWGRVPTLLVYLFYLHTFARMLYHALDLKFAGVVSDSSNVGIRNPDSDSYIGRIADYTSKLEI